MIRAIFEPALVFNTYWHSDHVGGNAGLAERFGMPIAASAADGRASTPATGSRSGRTGWTSRSTPTAWSGCCKPGELVETGAISLQVVPAAGHSLGQVALFEELSRGLVAGDAIMAPDVAWINVCG